MSYLRSPVYVWSDGYRTHIWPREASYPTYPDYPQECGFPEGICVTNEIFDFLALARVAEIEERGPAVRARIERSLLNKHGGNFGSYALLARHPKIKAKHDAEVEAAMVEAKALADARSVSQEGK